MRSVLVSNLVRDLGYGLRLLRKSPGFTAITVLTLALGIGANTAIFSLINAVLLRSLPVKDPQQLVLFRWTARHNPTVHGFMGFDDCNKSKGSCSFSLPFFRTIDDEITTFSGLAAFAGPIDIDFSSNGTASMTRGTFVSGDFFSTLGLKMFLGRSLSPTDDLPSAPPAIVLTYRYWYVAFGGDQSVVGRVVRLNNVSSTIVGVAGPGFAGLTPGKSQDFFIPFAVADRIRGEWWGRQDLLSDSSIWWIIMVGRLKASTSVGQAQAAATVIFRNQMVHGSPPMSTEAEAPRIVLQAVGEGLNGEISQVAPGLYLAMIIVAFVLLIACANVAGLQLARGATRQKEMAVRLALGAGHIRIISQLFMESTLLSFGGGVLGIVVAIWGVSAASKLISGGSDQPFPFIVAPDLRVLAFTVGITMATGILSGFVPALRNVRVDLTPSLKDSALSLFDTAGHPKHPIRLGDALVVAQVALSVAVLIGAGLLVRTLRNLETLDPGFDAHNILLFGINPTIAGYTDQQTAQLYSDLQQRFAVMPGVISASYSEDSLLSGSSAGDAVHLDSAPPKSNVTITTLPVGLNFFSTMRIPLVEGREFTSVDFAAAAAVNGNSQTAPAKSNAATLAARVSQSSTSVPPQLKGAPAPVIINQAFAQIYFPGQSALGKHMGDADWPTGGPGYVVVGIVGNTLHNLRSAVKPTMYSPLVRNSAHFELRTRSDPHALINTIRAIVSRAGDNLPLFQVRTQTEQIDRMLSRARLLSRFSSFFGSLAVVLACIGLYGLLSFEVARRTRELGIRTALGAQRRDLVRLIVRRGVILAIVGVSLGIAAAAGVTRYLVGMLYGVHTNDPFTVGAVIFLLIFVALLACYVPARRAMLIEPMAALRDE